MIRITHENERASIYAPSEDCVPAGGIDFARHLPGFGYMRCEDPSEMLRRLAIVCRNEAYPDAVPLTMADLEETCDPLTAGRDDERDTEADPFRLEML